MTRARTRSALIAAALLITPALFAQTPRRHPLRNAYLNPASLSAETPVYLPESSAAPFQQEVVSLASDGSSFLAAWRDARQGYGDSWIFASRLDGDGAPVDPLGIPIGRSNGYAPSVIWTGHHYLVLWSQYGSRVSAEGTVLDPSPVTVAPPGFLSLGAAAWNGTSLLVVGVVPETPQKYVWLLNEDLQLASPPRPLASFASPIDFDSGYAAASDGRDFIVVRLRRMSDYCPDPQCYAIFSERVSGDGVPDAAGHAIGSSRTYGMLTLTAGGAGYLLLHRDPALATVTALFLDSAGTPARPEVTVAPAGTWPVSGERPSAVWTGHSWLAAWYTPALANGFALVEITPEGGVSSGSIQPSSGLVRGADLAVAGSTFMAAWTAWPTARVDESDVFAGRLEGMNLATDMLVSRSESMQDRPSAATNGSSYLVLWTEYRIGTRTRTQLARRFDLAGAPLGPPFEVRPLEAVPNAVAEPFSTSLASLGTDYLLAWTDGKVILTRRLSGNGMWLDAEPRVFGSSDCLRLLGVASAPDAWAVMWTDCSGGAISVGRITQEGAPVFTPGVDAPAIIAVPGTEYPTEAVLSWNGERYLLVWTELVDHEGCQILCPAPRTRVRMVGLSRDLIPIGGVVDLSADTSYASGGVVAVGSANSLIAWQSDRGSRAVRVDNNGTILDPLDSTVFATTSFQPGLNAIWDGSAFVLLARERLEYDKRIVAGRIDPSVPLSLQLPLDRAVIVRASALAQSSGLTPAVASAADGRLLVAYARLPADPRGTNRVYERMIWGVGRPGR